MSSTDIVETPALLISPLPAAASVQHEAGELLSLRNNKKGIRHVQAFENTSSRIDRFCNHTVVDFAEPDSFVRLIRAFALVTWFMGAAPSVFTQGDRRVRQSCTGSSTTLGSNTVLRTFMLLAGFLLALPLHAAELTIDLAKGSRTWSTEQLLKHPQARDIDIPDDVSYKRAMHYRAVPVAALIEGVASDAHLQAVATDGFAAEMPAGPLLQKTGSRAWLAIEDPAHPWPALGKDKPGAGPFYLVWTDPAAGRISPEQWPYAVGKIRLLASVAERFPALLPDASLAANDPVNLGFALFQKNCFACHRLNGAGDSQLGPDLNIPHNPTEYFAGDYLKLYIRNPQALRQWPQAKMPAITPEVLSDAELDQVVRYLKHMAGRKVAP